MDTQSPMLNRLTPIFQDIMDDDELVVSVETKADDVDNWDSLTHIRLIVAIEKELNIRFTSLEISALENVGDLLDLISRKNGGV